jgi:two-component system, NtrC family, sensor kinase
VASSDDFSKDNSTKPPSSFKQESELEVRKTLLDRPRLSIRARVIFAFVMLFVLLTGITLAAIFFLSQVGTKIDFLEKVGNYYFEIQQARRYEKNYFLYGTNLTDALDNTNKARNLLLRNGEQIGSVIGAIKYSRMEEILDRYQLLLEKLLQEKSAGKTKDDPEKRQIEVRLRKHGAQILDDAQEMINRERIAVRAMLNTSMLSALSFLGFMFFIMFYISGVIIRAVLRPVRRFMKYMDRIGSGDYTPITPTRRYRDEFSSLAIAINKMLAEISTRQEQLMQSGKMAAVGTLTSGIAHELNNPLNNIGLTVEALVDGFDDYSDEDKHRMLNQVYTQVERASGIIRNLLDFTRKEQPAFTSVHIRETIENTARLVSNELKIEGIELELELEEELPTVRGNPRNLQQVFLNMFLNSIHAMPEGGKLSITAFSGEDGFLRVDVSDTGRGIEPQMLNQIFEPFFTTKDPGQGTGLGLSVSHNIIEKHGGKITVTSTVGKGTTFTIFLPIEKKD